MANCIICHLGIIDGLDEFELCPNGHPVHSECLKEWLIHSSTCPLCQEKYPESIIAKFESFLEERKETQKNLYENELKRESTKKIEVVADQVAFLKFVEVIEELIRIEEFEYALSRLEMYDDFPITNPKGQQILFLKGKINYLQGRYDLA
ncbi:MAG: E3 ubiquitin-protein ligase, partial [Promethearchaeota archaeon]